MLLVDAGPLVAAASRKDRHHARCVALLTGEHGPLVVPVLVLTEVAYFLGERLGPRAEVAFARSVANGELIVETPTAEDWGRIAQLSDGYADLPLGMVDASVVATAERLGTDRIATLDHRHFATVRPSHVRAFTLLP